MSKEANDKQPKAQAPAPKVRKGRGSSFFQNEPGRLAEQFIKTNYTTSENERILHCFNNQYYKYTGTHYKTVDRETLRSQVVAYVNEHASERRSTGLISCTWEFVQAAIRLSEEREYNTWLSAPPIFARSACIALQNGILALDAPAEGVRAHTPDWFSLTCLPFSYDPAEGCENWMVFLETIFGDDEDRIALLQEWFGYCLTPETSLNKLMLFEGPPRSGKGVCTDVLARMLGRDNVSNVRLEMFNDRFQLTETVGKLLNVCDETDQIERVAEATLKAFTGGTDKMYFDVKGRRGVHTAPTARVHILSNNGLPIYDRSSALVNRILHVQFERSFLGKEDVRLRERLYREAAGIFNWALEGYARIHAQLEFTRPERSVKALRQYEEQANPFKVWATEYLEYTGKTTDELLKREEVLMSHNIWLKAGGHKPISDSLAARQIRMLYPNIAERRISRMNELGERTQPWAWVGLRWKVIE